LGLVIPAPASAGAVPGLAFPEGVPAVAPAPELSVGVPGFELLVDVLGFELLVDELELELELLESVESLCAHSTGAHNSASTAKMGPSCRFISVSSRRGARDG
jgi:hypothetical protein